jgi:hypothetical protein
LTFLKDLQQRQVEKTDIHKIDAGIVGIEPGVVVHVHTGKGTTFRHALNDLLHHPLLWGFDQFAATPDPVVVRLSRQHAHTLGRRIHVTDEKTQGPGQIFPTLILGQQGSYGLPSDSLVTMH